MKQVQIVKQDKGGSSKPAPLDLRTPSGKRLPY